MSTISEVDLRDWDKVDCAAAREAADAMDDFARMANIKPIGPYKTLLDFILKVEEIKLNALRAATKRVPAILRKGEE